jgi:hypothetical protein
METLEQSNTASPNFEAKIKIRRRTMSVAGISASALSQSATQLSQPTSRRQQEDIIGRQFETALQSGDLAGAQQAYNALAAYGPNNSGPFKSPQLAADFQAVGQALQNGDLAGAQQAATTLGNGLLKSDANQVQQKIQQGGLQGAQQAIANLEGDYWAITGQGQAPNLGPPAPSVANSGTTSITPSAVNLIA